jgi:hypothetical protein
VFELRVFGCLQHDFHGNIMRRYWGEGGSPKIVPIATANSGSVVTSQRSPERLSLPAAQGHAADGVMAVCSHVCEQLGSQFLARGLFMGHLHVTHITEGLQIVKYTAPLICDKRNEYIDTATATATYTHLPCQQRLICLLPLTRPGTHRLAQRAFGQCNMTNLRLSHNVRKIFVQQILALHVGILSMTSANL